MALYADGIAGNGRMVHELQSCLQDLVAKAQTAQGLVNACAQNIVAQNIEKPQTSFPNDVSPLGVILSPLGGQAPSDSLQRLEQSIKFQIARSTDLIVRTIRERTEIDIDIDTGIPVPQRQIHTKNLFRLSGDSPVCDDDIPCLMTATTNANPELKDACAITRERSKSISSHNSKSRKQPLFAFTNVDEIKRHIRRNLLSSTKHSYRVEDMYKHTGLFQFIAKHPHFESLTLGMIIINALYMWLDVDWNKSGTMVGAEAVYIVGDSCFMSYFLAELLIRFMAFRRKVDCFKDWWFVFDAILVFLYMCDPFILSIVVASVYGDGEINLPTNVLRLLRLARLTRLTRILHSLPQLMTIIKSLMSATIAVGYALSLLMLVTYVFAIALRSLVPKDSIIEEVYFADVPESIHSLIVHGTFLDNLADFSNSIKEESAPCFVCAWCYLICASLMILNMLIGVLCEVISAVAQTEKEGIMVEEVKEKFTVMLQLSDANDDEHVQWDEFSELMQKPETARALASVDVNPIDLVEAAEDFFFDDDGTALGMPFEDFMAMVLDLRGEKQATVKDVMAVGRHVTRKFMSLGGKVKELDDKVSEMDDKISHKISDTGLAQSNMIVRECV